MKLTKKETAVLIALATNDYGYELGDEVWSHSILGCGKSHADYPPPTTRGLGGVVTSLVKKGLVTCVEDGEDSTVALTKKLGCSVARLTCVRLGLDYKGKPHKEPMRAKKVLTERDIVGRKGLTSHEIDAEIRRAVREEIGAGHPSINAAPKPRLARGLSGETKATAHSRAALQSTTKKEKTMTKKTSTTKKNTTATKKPVGRTKLDPTTKIKVLVKPADSGLQATSGRYAKLMQATRTKTVGAWLGSVVKDAAGKEHKCDMGALNGMLKRQHVELA